MEESKYFQYGFITVFAIIIGIFFLIYENASKNNPPEILIAFWSVFIFLFTLFGIIVISLFIEKTKKKGL
jgi:O-antigen ligase